jgi:predicted RNA-binding protein with RPS1 domain
MENINIKKDPTVDEFNWDNLYGGRKNRKPNAVILEKYGERIYCHEPYAEELFLAYRNGYYASKEATKHSLLKILNVGAINDKEIWFTCDGYSDYSVKIENEKRFFNLFGLTTTDFVDWLSTAEGREMFVRQGHTLYVEETSPVVKVSLFGGYVRKQTQEFFEQIKTPTTAYSAQILKRNDGGFLISVAGIEGFLPGSLAATNKIIDFDSYVGKEVLVMVEDYLKDSNTFVFSNKKYVNYVLPKKMELLSTEEKYTGSITGTAKYGIFVEFNEIFTGLLHTSKMTQPMKDKFNAGEFKPGQEISFWIREITNDKKIILTDEDPSVRFAEIEDFKEKNLGVIKGGEVISVKPFGTLVKIEKDIVGLISQKEIKNHKKKYNVGDKIYVTIEKVQNNKIFLAIPDEH